jgi:quinol monooxygenase YgiN
MPNNTLTVIARIKAKAGLEDLVRQELLALLPPTRSEEGCINYDLHQSVDDGSVFLFHETWGSDDALKRHFETPHLKALSEKAGELLDAPVEITLWKMIG